MSCCKKEDENEVVVPREGNRVLLVGINEYRQAPLNGCVNDVMDMADYLVEERGIDARDICILTDERASTVAINDKLIWLADTVPGHVAYFHFSGHGTQVPAFDEEDGLNEVICPYDFDWSATRMISDKDFVDIFRHMKPGVLFNWASDSCHSGDLSRETNGPEEQKRVPRRMPLPKEIAWQVERNRSKLRTLSRSIKQSALNVGYVSGCGEDQTSSDAYIGGRYCGAFTHFFLKHLRSEPQTTSLRKLAEFVSNSLRGNWYSQRPQVEGLRADDPFLG